MSVNAESSPDTARPGLNIEELTVSYRGVAVVRGVSLELPPGRVVALMGANGAGKSSLLRAIMGMQPERSGSVRYEGQEISGCSPGAITRLGIATVPEGRHVFASQSVAQNLLIGGWVRRRPGKALRRRREEIYQRFDLLARRRNQAAGTLSGGEAQLLAIAMALMSDPRVLLLDEPSLGLAPLTAEMVFEEISRLGAEGRTVLIVEQNSERALAVAAYGYAMHLGEIVAEGKTQDLAASDDIRRAYLGE